MAAPLPPVKNDEVPMGGLKILPIACDAILEINILLSTALRM